MTWPLTKSDLRSALGFKSDEGDDDELTLYITAACEAVDKRTGRITDPTRHLVNDTLPIIFTLAARETGKLWWQQSKNGPRGVPQSGGETAGPPMGAALPRKVEGWLEGYPAEPAIA